MEINDLHLWDIIPVSEPIQGCEIKCYRCGEWSNHVDWEETEVECEDCGSHAAIRCPKCEEAFDILGDHEFEVRQP